LKLVDAVDAGNDDDEPNIPNGCPAEEDVADAAVVGITL